MSDFSETAGKPIQCLAAVAYEFGKPLSVETITVAPPKKDEIRVKVLYNALCHTDAYTISGQDSEGKVPFIPGHEATAIIESIGEGTETDLKVGDYVIPAYTPECGDCKFCKSPSNLCIALRAKQGQGFMQDETTRYTNAKGEPIFHYMGCSTLSQYSVIHKFSAVKFDHTVFDESKVALYGCGISTGYGGVQKAIKKSELDVVKTVTVFGLGAVGLGAVLGAKKKGIERIIVVDLNSDKFELAKTLGATEFINPKDLDVPVEQHIVSITDGVGSDVVFEATGVVKVMESCVRAAARGWGVACVAGVAPSGSTVALPPFLYITGRTLMGVAMGSLKTVSQLNNVINETYEYIDHFITNYIPLADVNKGFDALNNGEVIRTIVKLWE